MREPGEIVNEILAGRGISTDDEIREFLSAKPQKTYDPFLLKDMEAGVDLLLSEIGNGTKLCIYGDYDADGVTSSCIMSQAVKYLTDNFFCYIPSRFREGYGLNRDAIDSIAGQGAGLVLTVDCGCVSYDEVEYAKEKGLKVIVTDHHNIEDVMADCIVIDPKRKDSGYPFRELAGCGVAFKFVQALQRKADLPKSLLIEVLDLVAIGTVGDIVSLTDENRTLVKYGLNVINSGRRKSITRLSDAISIGTVNSENIAFGIVPHINAAGRMDSAMEPVKLFMAEDDAVIDCQIEKLIGYNSSRKSIQEKAYNDCLNYITGDENFIVLNMPDIHEGIAGIVAGKIKDRFSRPAVIVTPSGDGCLKGTGRSVEGVDLYRVLNRHSDLFKRFGGHSSACGFLMDENLFDELKEALNSEALLLLEENPKLYDRSASWEAGIDAGEVTVDTARAVAEIGPFGEGNTNPKFRMQGIEITQLSFMGESGNHARFSAFSPKSGRYANCVLFRKAIELEDLLKSDERVNLVGTISLQNWRGQDRVQFIVEEMEKCR